MKIIVVGAGLFGSIAAALARKTGHDVTVIDSQHSMAASKCSGNLFKPSWLDSLGPERRERAYAVLRQLYRIDTLECQARVGPLVKRVPIDWVDPRSVLLPPDVLAAVTEVGDGFVKTPRGRFAGRVLVAAGVETARLVPMPPVKSLIGASLRIPGTTPAKIKLYAPYKHAVAFNVAPGEIWAGDGAAILAKNWEEGPMVARLRQRIHRFFRLDATRAEVRIGARPYVEGHKDGYFRKTHPRTWASTGGAKNGLILAAWQAAQFLEAL